MEEQVAQAAMAMVSPTTDSSTRRQASRFLEEWTLLTDAWDVYVKWLASFRHSPDPDKIAMQLLCLQMLQTKIRNEIPRGQPEKWHPSLSLIRSELWEYARQPSLDSSLVMPCCICNAIILVRCGLLGEFIIHIRSSGNHQNEPSPEITLRLIACVPFEMEACRDLTTPEVTHELQPHLELVLDLIRRGISSENTVLQSCMALKEWSNSSHISLSQLNTPTCNQPYAVLPSLLQILSSNQCQDERLLQAVSQALTASIMVVSDQCTPSRETAASSIWNAIPHGFIVNPLHLATQNGWLDACHALATLICNFVTEQVDDLVNKPVDMGLQLLLDIQAHPHTPVALIPLDCWLTIQEIPLEERHDHWKQPLFRQVLQTLVTRIAYTTDFTNWQEEFDLDSSEFLELRRMVTDVFVSGYFLLRVEFINLLTHQIRNAAHWTQSEAALNVLVQISREVCQRCIRPSRGGGIGHAIQHDRQATCQALIQLLDQLLSTTLPEEQHPILLGTIINFCGSYSPAWSSMDCPPHAILQLLQFLHSSFRKAPLESAKATRAIFVACLSKSMPSLEDLISDQNKNTQTIIPLVLKSVRESMEAVLTTTEEEAMTTVAEGATRLVTKLKDVSMARQALIQDLVRPVLHRARPLLQTLSPSQIVAGEEWCTPPMQLALESLVRLLNVVHVIVRFCDAPYIPATGEWLLEEIGPFLDTLQRQPLEIQKVILRKWVAIQQQLLRLPAQQSTVLSMISNTIPLIVQALQTTHDPSTLKYISAAVEMFGGKTDEMDHSFKDLLSHITTIITSQLSSNNLSDATELLERYFECLQRFILYCPRALCYNTQFATILTLAVESIAALQGAKESTRAALLFLSQLFGWNSLRLSPQAHQVLQEAWRMILKDMLVHHGSTLTQSCVVGLAGGPQMLWPAYSDCLFAIVQSVLNSTKEDTIGNNDGLADQKHQLSEAMMQNWLLASMTSAISSSKKETINVDICNQVISILFGLARTGTKGRSKGKMLLTDFAKLSKGEMTPDALVSYAIS
jgi:hypothetical protein